MNKSELENTIENLSLLERCEQWLAVLYQTSAGMWPEEKGFWDFMEHAELTHSKNIERLKEMLVDKSEEFVKGMDFHPLTVETMIEKIKQEVGRLKNGELSKKQFLIIARDLEDTMLESKYFDVMRSANQEFQDTVKKIRQETMVHKKQIDERLKSVSSEQ